MKRSLAILVLSLLCQLGTAIAEQAYQGEGFSFTYSPAESVTTEGGAIKTITITGEHEASLLLQNHGDAISPEALSAQIIAGLVKKFPSSLTEIKHKLISRKLFGEERRAHYFLLTKQDIDIELLLFSFQHQGQTLCVISQMPLPFTKSAESMFQRIQSSLKLTH